MSISNKLKQPDGDHTAFESSINVPTVLEQAWAGVVFTLLFFLLAFPVVFAVYSFVVGGMPISEAVLVAFASLICTLVGATVIPVLASFVAIVVIMGFNWSFSDLLSPRLSVVIFGSLSGYCSTAWLLVFWGGLFVIGPQVLVVMFVSVTMFAGYLGGIVVTARKGVWKYRVAVPSEERYQFEIKHVFVLTFWTCLLLALDRAVGDHRIIFMFLLYAVVQGMILMFDSFFRNWRRVLRFIPFVRIAAPQL